MESGENREYGEFSWRLGALEPVLSDLQFIDPASKVEGDNPNLTAVPFGPDTRPRL